MEEAKKVIEKELKKALKFLGKHCLRILFPIVIVIVLLAYVTYNITIDDGTYKDKDWSSTPYAAEEYVNSVSVNDDGTLNGTSVQELWDKMIKNKNRVDKYLDSPEELARLMKAEIVTKYPDTRKNPDEEINWDNIIADADALQGVIKFKRADEKGNISTLTYVDSKTFYDWIELYAQTGNETYKNKALSHFTLCQNASNNSNSASEYTTSDIKTNYSDRIVNAAKQVASPGAGLCQSWVRQVYAQAGLGNAYFGTAYEAFKSNCISTSKDNIPIGAVVYGTGSGSYAGHVGIYIGNGMVMDNVGYIKTSTLDEWISWQEQHSTVIAGVQPGWLGWGWQSGSPSINFNQNTVSTDNSKYNDSEDTEHTASSYTAVIATWTQVYTKITSNDPNVEQINQTQYIMTTTNINYEDMVVPYTMPFDFLWALLVVGEDKNFVFELADLVYGSDIQITVYDNLTVNTDVDESHYTKKTKAVVNATITASCGESTATGSINNDIHDPDNDIHDPDLETEYIVTTTVITHTNTVNVALTKANVWIVNYQNDYTYTEPTEDSTSNKITQKDEDYPNSPNSTSNSYSCGHINSKKQELSQSVKKSAKQGVLGTLISNDELLPVVFNESIDVKYYSKYVNIYNNITNTVNRQKYVEGVPLLDEKTDKDSEEPNFVTIFNKDEYRKNKANIKDVDDWLFEILENNDSTANMVDLMKYLLYKATGNKYDGVEEFNFYMFYPSQLTSVGEGDYIVHIDKSSKDIVIDDIETLKKAFSGYSGNSELIKHAQEFLDLQKQYRVNAIFAAAVSISETSAGRAGHATDGKNNWFNIECTCGNSEHGRFETYTNKKESIEAFYKQISVKNYYFTEGKYTVSDIGIVYCENADVPGGWIEKTTNYMTQMFNAAGISLSSSETSEKGETIVKIARSKLGSSYVYGTAGPNTFDCSGLTYWCYNQVGISIPRNSESQKKEAKKVVSVSEARVGDILWRNGHVAIYIGNNQYIHAPQSGDVVKIATGVNSFKYAIQFY